MLGRETPAELCGLPTHDLAHASFKVPNKLIAAAAGRAMIENIRTHPYRRAVCLETARLFERQAAKDLVEAQCSADEGALDRARELQAKARLAQQRANAWHVRARNASV